MVDPSGVPPPPPQAPPPLPTDQNFLNFMQFFGNVGKNYMLPPPPPPAGTLAPRNYTYSQQRMNLILVLPERCLLLHQILTADTYPWQITNELLDR